MSSLAKLEPTDAKASTHQLCEASCLPHHVTGREALEPVLHPLRNTSIPALLYTGYDSSDQAGARNVQRFTILIFAFVTAASIDIGRTAYRLMARII